MLQPFEKFRHEYIDRLISLNKPFLVSQTYRRAVLHLEAEHSINLLLTDYDDSGLAKTHLNAVKEDQFAALINLKNEKHVKKVLEMLEPGSGYGIYWAIVHSGADLKKQIDLKYTDQVRRYILKNTDWRISADETIKPSLKVIFGEMYMIIRRGSQHELRVKFAEIEKA